MPTPLIAWPRLNGAKGRMANLCGAPTDSYTGDYGSVGNLYDVWYDWPWTTWIKPQIDAMSALGANVVRFIFDANLRIGDSGHTSYATWRGTITDQQMVDRHDQLITYLDSLGMYFYATASEAWALSHANYIDGNPIQSFIARYAQMVSAYSNVVGLDICNEHDANYYTNLYKGNMIAAARAAMVTQIPVTASVFSFYVSGATWGATPADRGVYGELVTAGVDYIDNHFYTHAFTTAELAPLFALNLPFVIGEMGIPYSGNFATGAGDAGSASRRAAYYDAIVALSEDIRIQATGVWAAVQMSDSPGNDWGLYGKTQDGSSMLTDPRTEMASRFQLIPKAYPDGTFPSAGRFSSVFAGVVR